MKVDLNKVLSIHIDGEVAKNNSLPIDYFINISKNLQELLISIAKHDLNDDLAIDLSNFKIELCGFKEGSAVPQYKFTNNIVYLGGVDVAKQRKKVSESFNSVLEIADSGEYDKIKTLYESPVVRNEIVDKIYNYTNSFGDSPVSIVNINNKGKIIKIYDNHRLNKEAKDRLKVSISKQTLSEPIEEEAVGTILIKKTANGIIKNKIKEIYNTQDNLISYKVKEIVINGLKYGLHSDLIITQEKENDYYVMTNDMLGIVGTGQSVAEAKISLMEEFDYIYKRYNNLNEEELSPRLSRIKSIINLLVIKVKKS